MSLNTPVLWYLLLSVLLLGVIVLLLVIVFRRPKQQPLDPRSDAEVEIPAAGHLQTTSNALFATLSHELRTPLNGLLGLAQILQEESPSEESNAIEGCARHMKAVIATLVNLSKIQMEWDDLPEYREWVNVYDLMEQIKQDSVFRTDLCGMAIKLKHQDKLTRLRGDGDHLRAIIENALFGSIDSVSLVEIPTSKQTLEMSWFTDGGEMKVEIVNPREQPSNNRRQEIEGIFQMTTGENQARMEMRYLYWAVSSALLDRYQGRMDAVSNEGGGVTTLLSFKMEQMKASASGKLPIDGLRLDQEDRQSKAMLPFPVQLSLIIAEDDPVARKLMATVLGHMKQQVVFATNGLEVLELVKEATSCDLILMDIDMPIMDGMAASLALRAGEAGEIGQHVPIVALTAFGTLSDEGKFKRVGMDYFLPKPVELNKLREVLLDVIRKQRSSGE